MSRPVVRTPGKGVMMNSFLIALLAGLAVPSAAAQQKARILVGPNVPFMKYRKKHRDENRAQLV